LNVTTILNKVFSALFRIISTIAEAVGAERDRDEFRRL